MLFHNKHCYPYDMVFYDPKYSNIPLGTFTYHFLDKRNNRITNKHNYQTNATGFIHFYTFLTQNALMIRD